jgi:hypothetical protein
LQVGRWEKSDQPSTSWARKPPPSVFDAIDSSILGRLMD